MVAQYKPIGIFYALEEDKYALPRQPDQNYKNIGKIVLAPDMNFEQALEGLEGFDRVWILFEFDRALNWKPKVMPRRGGIKRGVFATRSPHRPNPIGMSCVQLIEIRGREIYVGSHDILNLTPILDVKPYIDYADSFVSKKQGWLGDLADAKSFKVNWTIEAERQELFLRKKLGLALRETINQQLHSNPLPYPSNRIKEVHFHDQKLYEYAYKSWRIQFGVDLEENSVNILGIQSGYDNMALEEGSEDKWKDASTHRQYRDQFKNFSFDR